MGIHRNSPNSSPKLSSSKQKPRSSLKSLLDLDSRYRQAHRSSEYEEILSLISYCSYTCTFSDPSESPSLHNLKRDKLVKLLSVVQPMKKGLPGEVLSPLFTIIQEHLFRPLPPPTTSIMPEDDDLVSTPNACWPHLQLVYDILLCLVVNSDPNMLLRFFNDSFILNLLALFQSEDARERDCLKNVIHKVYSRFHFLRSFMRKAMRDVFLDYTFEADRKHCGIGDLLEIWGTIINGFSTPLKEEHRVFLMRVLVPLHRPKGMQGYYKQLAYCVNQFVEKDPLLGVAVVRGVLRYWPATNCQKEVVLIGEMEELVENMGSEQYKAIAVPLCRQIKKCLISSNSQVAERALYVWNNERFVKMAMQAVDEVLPVLVEGMEENLRGHWSKSVRQLTENVKEMLVEMEPNLYSKCLAQLHHNQSAARKAEMARRDRWERVEMAAKLNQFIQESLTPRLPAKQDAGGLRLELTTPKLKKQLDRRVSSMQTGWK